METTVSVPSLLQKILIYCGIIAPLMIIGTDLLAGKLIPGYSFTVNSMSDLSSSGSPTRQLVVSLNLMANLAFIAFGIGVWRAFAPAILPGIVAGLIIGYATTGMIATLFFPNQYGIRPEFGTPGVLLMFVSVLFFVLAMIFGAVAFHGWLRVLSIIIPATYVLLAVLRFATAASAAASTSGLIGVQERSMTYGFLFWVIGLAIFILK